jgi:hypothetical protein
MESNIQRLRAQNLDRNVQDSDSQQQRRRNQESGPLGRYNFKSRNDMNQELKLLAAIGIMPVLADFLEDLNEDKAFRTDMKIATQNLIGQIRKLDERIMKNASAETSEQQINIQIAFRQWLNTAKN